MLFWAWLEKLLWCALLESFIAMWSESRDLLITECVGGGVTNAHPLVASGGEESSEHEFVEEEKPWPPDNDALRMGRSKNKGCGCAPRLPRPHSHLFRIAGRARASKHRRRWENCESVASLVINTS